MIAEKELSGRDRRLGGDALYSLLYDHVNKKGPETLPDLVPTLVYVTLAPFLSAEEAYEVAIG